MGVGRRLLFVAPRYTAKAPCRGFCLFAPARPGGRLVCNQKGNEPWPWVCLRRVRPAANGASAGRGLLTVAPAGPGGDFGCVQYGYTASRARCVWLLCGYVVGGASYSFGEVQERAAQLFRFGGGEAPGASVAVDSV